MEHLLEDIVWLQDKLFMRGFIFGLVHTIIPLVGFYSGWSINRLLKIVSNGYVAGIFGLVIAHVVADFIASTLDPDIRPAVLGIVLGGLVPLIIVPFMEKYYTKSKHHIVVGDHEDVKKDLESH
tara:strand:+ start:153 stop:524 length:372 start_codon:yes stop_codon:yes gene_type:complete